MQNLYGFFLTRHTNRHFYYEMGSGSNDELANLYIKIKVILVCHHLEFNCLVSL